VRSLALTAVILAGSFIASPVRADEVADFGAAQLAYAQADYARAVTLFESMVGGATPRIQNEVLVTESRKYLAASLLFQGREADARVQFTRLIESNPDYILDAVAFPAAVHATFSEVKAQVRAERANREAAQEAAERERRERAMRGLVAQQERIARLEVLAQEVTVEETRSRWIATLPFGTGQLQNGDRTLGLTLLSSQIFLATTSVVTFVYHQFLIDRGNAMVDNLQPVDDRLLRLERGVRITNQISTGLLGAVALAGIIDAQVRFREGRSTTRRRELPEDLQGIEPIEDPEAVSVRVNVGLGYAELTLGF
jgi:hypothetical protein